MASPSSDIGYPGTPARFGPAGFAACVINMLVLELITWFMMPMFVFIPFLVLPLIAVNVGIAFVMTKIRLTAQVGRGMLISCIAAPLSFVLAASVLMGLQSVSVL